MKKLNLLAAFSLLITVAMLLFAGCSEDSKSTDNNLPTTAPKIARVTPAEGSASAALKPIIGIKFDMPMDTTSFMHNFHFTANPNLPEWMDSLQHHRDMMGGGMMNMGHMMDWLDSTEYHGDFDWNDMLDSCTFIADSTLMPNTSCMLYIYGDVRGRNGMMMDMRGYQYGGEMAHFRTRQ